MLEFTLKFLSGDSRKYEVDESTTVRQFKERLREELTIPIERQRLIFQGKVLQDDTKLSDSNIQNKTVHFVERAEPIPPPTPTNSTGATATPSGFGGATDGGMDQAMMDEVNETTSIFINAFPGAANLQPNDIQSLVQNLLNDLGDVGRQARVNTTMALDGHGVDINIDFGDVNQVLEQQEINERFRSMGRMLTRLKLRIDRLEHIVESNFRPSPTPPPAPPSTTTEQLATPPRPAAPATVPPPSSTSSTTFLGMEDITSTEMDAESQGSVQSTETLRTPPSTTSTTPVDSASTPTTNNPPASTTPRTVRDLADLMNTTNTEQQRLQTHYQTYLRTIVQSDPFDEEIAGRQRFYSLYNESLHLLAHINHNMTDITLDLNNPIATRSLHLGELPISQAGLASVASNAAGGQEGASRGTSRVSRPMGRRSTAMATARLMGPIQIGPGGTPTMVPGDMRMQFQNPMGVFPRMVFNAPTRPGMPFRPPAPATANNGGMQQSMRFNLGTLPYTFMQMGPEGLTLNQVSASVVADVQTSDSASSGQQPSGNRPTPTMNAQQGATHVISSGPIQLNGGQFDANIAAQIAQSVSNSVQQQIAQMVSQQMPGGAASHGQPMNNQNMNAANPSLRPTFVLQPESAASSRATENLRSRSADSRPLNSTAPASNIEDDEADWVDVPMDMPMPSQAVPNLPMYPTPRFRGPAIIQSIDRSLPCTSPYFTQTLRPPFDNPNNASNITPNEAAAMSNAAGRTMIFATAPQRPRGRHRHPAGPWAQQQQQQQQQIPNFMFGAPGMPQTTNVLAAAGQPYNMTAHSFEIPMVISTSTTTEIPTSSLPNNNGQTPTNGDGQQVQINTIISQVLSQILPGVLRSGNGRVRLNIGQNNPNENAPPQPTATNPPQPPLQQAASTPNTTNIPGVMAGGLDFSNIARSIGNMVQGMAGRLIPGATLANTAPPSATANVTSTTPSSGGTAATASPAQGSGATPRPTSAAGETDMMTEQMLGELIRLLAGGMDNPELENLTIGSFMQRFGEDVEAQSNDGNNLISELFSTMTARMRFNDVWSLVLGNPVGPRINEARQSATQYLRTTLLRGRPVTPETLDEVTDRLYESLLREASVNFSELRVKPNINLANVMKRFFRHHVRKLLAILFEDSDAVWFERFRQQIIAMRNEYLALSAHCLEGGESAATDFILNRHRIIFRSTNQMIVTWSETYLRTTLTTAFNGVRASPPSISAYLVEPPPIVERPVQVAPAPAAVPRATPPMASTVNRIDREREGATAITTTANPSWQANLPEDWIPIVVRDVNTQRDAPAQPPFSDAYKDGMPAKRRRVHLREDLTTASLLQTIVHRASSAGTAASAESVLSGESASPVLVETFEQELKRLLEQRVRQDRDYPEVKHRMPNTKRYLDGDQ